MDKHNRDQAAEVEPRIRPPQLKSLDEAQQRVYDAIAAGPRGEVAGPLGVWLWRPELADRGQRLGEYARYQTCLSPHLSELAILVVGRFWGAEYEWYIHKKIALEAGVPADVVESIRTRQEPVFDDPDQAVVYEFSATVLNQHRLDDDLYARARQVLGENGVIDLVGILGYYTLISMTINVFRVPTPAGIVPELMDDLDGLDG